jgi:hypothetical protein
VILCGVFVLQVTKDVDRGGLGAPGSAERRKKRVVARLEGDVVL